MTLSKVLHSRAVLVLGVLVAVAVPVATLPRLPDVNPWLVLAGLVPWIFGKYVLCPLRWRAVTAAEPAGGLNRRWYFRAFAESELLGLLTPGHVGADVWRVHRLSGVGVGRGDAVLSVATDRLVGAIGLAVFVAFAATALPTRMVVIAAVVAAVAILVVVLMKRVRPRLLPSGSLPRPRALLTALLLAAGYQLTIAALLLGTIAATGHMLDPLTLLAAFGVSQVAAALPGPNGASPRDGALVVALVASGLPWLAAAAAVTLRATLAWLPALALGGLSLLLRRQAAAAAARPVAVAA